MNMEDDDYGQYRKARAQVYGGPTSLARTSAGRPAPLSPNEARDETEYALRTGAIRSRDAGKYYAYLKAGGTPVTQPQLQQPSYLGGLGMTQSQSMQYNAMISALMTAPARPHEPTKLKSEGVRAGEVIAWRAWNIHDGSLVSVVAEAKPWSATEPMKGDAAGGYGVHAYKAPHGPLLDNYVTKGSAKLWVIGEVALWGDIIEHTDGYRSEYARVHSLVTWHEKVDGNLKLALLHKYLAVQEFKLDDAA